jgi:hypothetical protein
MSGMSILKADGQQRDARMTTQPERLLPTDPVGMIGRCVREGKLFWTWHVTMRLRERFISRRMIVESVDSYELIESYPDDKYLPSYLILARHEEFVFHALFAVDVKDDNVRIVTAYRPAPDLWGDDLKERGKP